MIRLSRNRGTWRTGMLSVTPFLNRDAGRRYPPKSRFLNAAWAVKAILPLMETAMPHFYDADAHSTVPIPDSARDRRSP